MLADRGLFRALSSEDRRLSHVMVGVLLAGWLAGGCGGSTHQRRATSAAVRQAQSAVSRAPAPLSAYRGPKGGPPLQPRAPVVFVAAGLTDGGIAAVARGVQQATREIHWPLVILDGAGNVYGQRQALLAAMRLRPGGIILGGVDAAGERAVLKQAQARDIPVVGWHSTVQPGPDRTLGLFTNVTSDPAVVGRLAADYAIAASHGTAQVVIFADPENAIETYTAQAMKSEIAQCPGCSVLSVIEVPSANAAVGLSGVFEANLLRFGSRWNYMLATDGAYVDGSRAALIGAGRAGDQPPFSISAGAGDESEFERIRANDYQKATIAEPLNLQGWQLIDELNRARAHQPPSGYVAPPRLITAADVPSGEAFDPLSGYRQNYLRIWGR